LLKSFLGKKELKKKKKRSLSQRSSRRTGPAFPAAQCPSPVFPLARPSSNSPHCARPSKQPARLPGPGTCALPLPVADTLAPRGSVPLLLSIFFPNREGLGLYRWRAPSSRIPRDTVSFPNRSYLRPRLSLRVSVSSPWSPSQCRKPQSGSHRGADRAVAVVVISSCAKIVEKLCSELRSKVAEPPSFFL
jgi:hypothetical protein